MGETAHVPIVVLARNPTDSFIAGLLPALRRTDLGVVLLTDHPDEHERRIAGPAVQIVGCEVTRLDRVLAALPPRCDAVLSNSDHLQTQTALAADYLGLPGKDWRSAARARDKGLMRATLAASGLDDTVVHRLHGSQLPAGVPFPAVLKPAAGVASEDVVLVRDAADLARRVRAVRAHRDGDLLVEALLEGPLHTLETLGDAATVRPWGGYRTTVSPPPAFIEQRLTWAPPGPAEVAAVLARLRCLGAGFGACHTEYVVTPAGVRLVEVNDRLIGDHCDFTMAEIVGEDVFDQVVAVHLGAPVPGQPVAGGRAGLVHWVLAPGDGRLRTTARAGEHPAAGGAMVTYHPIRHDGDVVRVTGTNRDYLGSVQVVAPDDVTATRALADFVALHEWVVR
ncbi:acetyl-CoA carboxylase biotin carboxylase subunit family protein [Spongisporangium articulatum]|uniref:Acetyl-CoA carboxylase biotin carboxylase subunit family protein n=1 Tax=Spongisporangium articulatum TaxID=3362603 RepID=A0ABW8AMD2_9ACTN